MNTDGMNTLKIEQISVNDIIPNRFQPRKNFDAELLSELAESIREYGIIQPLILRKLGEKYEIIAGERRYKAACMAGLSTVPSIIMTLDDTKSAEVALIENIQRRDLTAIEEAKSYEQILGLGQIKQEELGNKIGKNQSTISNKLRLLKLSNEAQKALLENKISERHARSLLRLKDEQKQNETLNKIINDRMTVRETDKYIKDLVENNNVEESDDEILDFSDDIEIKKGDNMNNNENTNTVIDNFTPSSVVPNIPDYDQININAEQQNGAYINEEVVNNAQVNEPSRFFNYDNQAANMNFDSTFTQNTQTFNNEINETNNMQQQEQVNDSQINQPMPNIPLNNEMNNIGQPSVQSNSFNQEIQPNNIDMNNPTNNQMNNMTTTPFKNETNENNNINNFTEQNTPFMTNQTQTEFEQPANIFNNQQEQSTIPNQFQTPDINQMQNQQPMNNQFQYMQPNINEQINQMNNASPYQNEYTQQPTMPIEQNVVNNMNQPVNNYEPEQNINNTSSQPIIMQQDITGAVAVIRNTIMNLQNNGYGIEINEQDLGNLYQIVINFKK